MGPRSRRSRIAAGELTVKVITFGAVIRDVRLAGIDHPLVLGFDRLEDYVNHSPHFGAVAGRSANRIGSGRFAIDGSPINCRSNEKGRTHLHGGFMRLRQARLAARRPRCVERDARHSRSRTARKATPATSRRRAAIESRRPGTIRMEAEATTDAPTLVNLAQHSYFNLDDSADILDHRRPDLRRGLHADRCRQCADRRDPAGRRHRL